MSHITQALIDEAVAYCLTGRRPPFTVHEIQQLLNAWQERDTLRAKLAAAEARAERCRVALEWIQHQYLDGLTMRLVVEAEHDGQYFVCGDSGKPGYGPTLLDAVESAALAEGGRHDEPFS